MIYFLIQKKSRIRSSLFSFINGWADTRDFSHGSLTSLNPKLFQSRDIIPVKYFVLIPAFRICEVVLVRL